MLDDIKRESELSNGYLNQIKILNNLERDGYFLDEGCSRIDWRKIEQMYRGMPGKGDFYIILSSNLHLDICSAIVDIGSLLNLKPIHNKNVPQDTAYLLTILIDDPKTIHDVCQYTNQPYKEKP